jgi:hypothetical protein
MLVALEQQIKVMLAVGAARLGELNQSPVAAVALVRSAPQVIAVEKIKTVLLGVLEFHQTLPGLPLLELAVVAVVLMVVMEAQQ